MSKQPIIAYIFLLCLLATLFFGGQHLASMEHDLTEQQSYVEQLRTENADLRSQRDTLLDVIAGEGARGLREGAGSDNAIMPQ